MGGRYGRAIAFRENPAKERQSGLPFALQKRTGQVCGQQQRLCRARTLAVGPEAILMDEPCPAPDLVAAAKIENLADMPKQEYTVIIVTHNLQQAALTKTRR
jgi:ABC-type phosphate transport system ATPase subunit